jgi:hypothetical protein
MTTKLTYVTLIDDLIGSLGAADIEFINEIADYPGTKITTIEMADTARATPPTKLRLNFGVDKYARFWAILNHNIIDGDLLITSYNDEFVTPSGESMVIPFRTGDMKGYGAALSAKQYWEVDPSGCSFADAFFEIGKVIAAPTVYTFANNYSDFQRGLIYRNIYNETVGGVTYAHRIATRRFKLDISWNASLVSSALSEILTLLELTSGGAFPFLLIPDNSEAEFYYVRADDTATWRESANRAYLTGLTLSAIELSRGKIQVETSP